MKQYHEQEAISVKSFLAWGSLVFGLLVVFIQRQYLAVIGGYMAQRYGLNLAEISYLSTATLYGYALMQIPTGVLADKIGVRKLSIGSWGLTLLASVGVMFATHFTTAWIMRFMIGAGTACSVTSLMKIQAVSFPKKHFSRLSSAMALLDSVDSRLS